MRNHAARAVPYPGMGRMRLALARADDALTLGSAGIVVDVHLGVDAPWSSNDELAPTALPLLEEALLGIGDDDLVRRVQIMNGIASDLYFIDPAREEVFARDAVALAALSDDPGAHATAQLA